MKKRCLAIALCFLLLPALTGCVSDLLVEKESTGDTLPDVRPGPSAPVGDSQSDRRVSAVLYLPDAELTRLTAQDRTVSVEAGDSLEKAVVDALLAEINASDFRPGQSVSLAPVSNAVEVTRDLVTVNLGTSARALGSEALFALRMAITNTLTTLTDINYVNILINGRDPGLDVRMLLPTGVLSRYPSTDISAQLTQVSVQRSATDGELQKTVALYFPSEDGEMLLGEVRDVTFSSRDLALYAQVLLEELQIGPLQSGMRAIVPPQDYFERSPSLTVVNGTDRYMEIYLREETDDYLLLNGGTRAQLLGSICYTLTSFIPELEGIVAYIGGETVTSLTLADGSTWSSPTARLTRETFASFAADMCTVYFPLADGTGLRAVQRPIAQNQRTQPRALLRELMDPPSDPSFSPALPQSVSDADILGLQITSDTALVNLSDAFAAACAGMTAQQERDMIYAIVNTLTELGGVARVRLYVDGVQSQLAGHLFIGGEFLRHTGLIRP